MVDYLDCKYLTIVGHVQSGKTNEELNFVYASVNNQLPVIFVVRNIRADQLQLVARIEEFNKTLKIKLKVKVLSQMDKFEIPGFLAKNYVIILPNINLKIKNKI